VATPTITSVTPGEGHTGGKTLVELVGTGFRLPADPPATGPAPAPPPSVRVKFGGREATEVQVWSETRLYCLTPDQDELFREVTWSSVDAATNTLTANGHGLANGAVVRLAETAGRLPPPLQPETAYYVVGATANTFQLAATSGGAAIDITATASGKVRVIDAYDVTLENLLDNGPPVAGETVTAVRAFTFRRPDLGEESELARVFRSLMRMLKRQVLENVAFTTHTDFDPTTADTLNLAYVQRLPAIVLANVETPDDPEYRIEYDEDIQVGEDRFIQRRAPAVVMLKLDLIGVSDDPIEVLNLLNVVRIFFRKNPYLRHDRDPADASRGQVRYDLQYTFAGPASVTHQGENTNVESFAAEVRVRGILLEDMPGITTAKVPGMPAGLPHEATRQFGYTTTDDEAAVDLTAEVALGSTGEFSLAFSSDFNVVSTS
jgi:hypothetical protein